MQHREAELLSVIEKLSRERDEARATGVRLLGMRTDLQVKLNEARHTIEAQLRELDELRDALRELKALAFDQHGTAYRDRFDAQMEAAAELL